MRKEQIYYVYFMISSSRRALYLGMTSGLRNRAWQHKNKAFEGFSSKYNCTRLVYFEIYDDVRRAIAREKAAPEGRQLSVIRNSKSPEGIFFRSIPSFYIQHSRFGGETGHPEASCYESVK
jgi:putative endonuclease